MRRAILISILLIISIILGYFTSDRYVDIMYSVGLSAKDIVVFFVPFIIFLLITGSLMKLQGNIFRPLSITFLMIVLSNALVILIGYTCAYFLHKYIHIPIIQIPDTTQATSFIRIKPLLSSIQALISSVLFTTYMRFLIRNDALSDKVIKYMQILNSFIIRKLVLPLLPIFISCFIIRTVHDKILFSMISQYLVLFLVIVFIVYLYLFILAVLIVKDNLLFSIKELSAPAMLSMVTLSSNIAIVLLLNSVKNIRQKMDLTNKTSEIVLPATINFHLIGDGIGLPIISLMCLYSFTGHFPTISEFIIVAFHLLIAKFAVVSIPGGTIMVLAPVFIKYLGFSDVIVNIVMLIDILLFDFILTPANVIGNGLLGILIDKLNSK
ncbi:MAG: hypothetical protein P857_884 [Candidatus Xenolissoclinum pacificiensis L6]|uniref:Sodium:dicarboxylate symporter family protein n=1 Tax=Candidatus Xenolissoclinum pacificiensis L6 TaxID=1401685 RepID=W2V252_9RICK|nr:MAG: hypothetical protein P857_884 [Candidatus Xenolissoclinum pacificiensis L6]